VTARDPVKLEWLETNGTGAFAMGTVAGVNTRRYHALLVASLRPPVERYVLLSRVDEHLVVDGQTTTSLRASIRACCFSGGIEHLQQFRIDPCATWRFALNGTTLEKQVYLVDGRQAVVIRYRADRPVTLRSAPFLAYRDYHSLSRARDDVFGRLPRLEFEHTGLFENDPHWYTTLNIWSNSNAVWIFARICSRPA